MALKAQLTRQTLLNREVLMISGQTRSVRENFETRRLLADRQRRNLQRVAVRYGHCALG
ncbi:hypothetical protein Spb1_41210 [Planctopirus ephydatiae]|uniref:Uncharacterized protein n=1 Tax=Planctopirus ephydatiae TaxID=2528019 RepID=A0A518GUB9_9PLAN|nr:hypothetical protein Spb1_41210 [Planctopirus ephydatiae]